MAIDLSKVSPLQPKGKNVMEQALRRHAQNGIEDFDDMLSPDLEWLRDDKEAIQNLVKQMDHSISDLAMRMRQAEATMEQNRQKTEKEQHLLFKQIKTLNGLLKKQVDIFTSIEKQIKDVEVQQSQVLPQVGIGLMAGFMSAVTILVTAPWLTVFIESIR